MDYIAQGDIAQGVCGNARADDSVQVKDPKKGKRVRGVADVADDVATYSDSDSDSDPAALAIRDHGAGPSTRA